MNSIKSIFGFFFGFKGRIGRLHYGLFLPVFTIIYLFITGFITLINQNISNRTMRGTFGSAEDFLFLAVIFAVVALVLVFKYSHIVRRISGHLKQKYLVESITELADEQLQKVYQSVASKKRSASK